jgi:RHS repeat-associated protein
VEQIAFSKNSLLKMTTTKAHDALNRLTNISSVDAQSATLSSFAYSYNSASQRTQRREADQSYWVYNYDTLGQVTSGRKYWSDGTPVAGQQFEYAFDEIGNRLSTVVNGHAADYDVNLRNQYTSREIPGFAGVSGSAHSNATVTLWGDNGAAVATSRKGGYYFGELPVDNSSLPVWLTITNIAVLNTATNDIITNSIGSTLIPKTREAFWHDPDGNLTNDGRWVYTWDAENRLVAMTNIAIVPAGAKLALTFAYDHQSRRIEKAVFTWNPGTSSYQLASRTKFAYDGWNLIAALNSQLSPISSFAWGLDLSGNEQGAGGVGGLLWIHDLATINNQPSTHFACFDGNGNVTALLDGSSSTLSAHYEYGPFGEVIRATGPACGTNPFRFSTKYQDDETDLLYYGYRYYSASTGRWLSQDPYEELAFRRNVKLIRSSAARLRDRGELSKALLVAVANSPVNRYDVLGLYSPTGPLPDGTCCLERSYPKTCDQICREVAANRDINNIDSWFGTVVCYHSKACVCVFGNPETGWTYGECPEVDAAIREHENDHLGKTKCSGCGIYRAGQGDLPPGTDLNAEECVQRKKTLQQLESVVGALEGRCKDTAGDLIAELSKWVKDNCR